MRPLALATATTLAVASGVALAPQDPHPPVLRLSPAVAAANTVPRPSVDDLRASRSIGARRAMTRARIRAAQRARERARALARKQAAAAARERAAATSTATTATATGVPAVWEALVQCEATGNWAANTGNGFYGGPQFSLGTWAANGGYGMPYAASPAEQVEVARRVLATQGVGAWPICGPLVGLKPGD